MDLEGLINYDKNRRRRGGMICLVKDEEKERKEKPEEKSSDKECNILDYYSWRKLFRKGRCPCPGCIWARGQKRKRLTTGSG